MLRSSAIVRVLFDYRPALRQRSGVGEYVVRLLEAFAATKPPDDELWLFSSSARDRVLPSQIPQGVRALDRRIPVRVLNMAWHRLEWPPVEMLAGQSFDILHSPHPLLIPARRGARIVTIHDLDFLRHPERSAAEVRRDYARLVEDHAHRADHVVVSSAYTAGEVHQRLGVPRSRISVCRVGAPAWPARQTKPRPGHILFMGTLEPRKNVAGLLEAYAHLLHRLPDAPDLVLAGRATAAAQPWLDALKQPPLAGRARHLGYVTDDVRRELYEGARLLVLPSFDEGFGIPVLEAMTVGVPVVAAERGALPEVLGDAGQLVDPMDAPSIAQAMERVLREDRFAELCTSRGLRRARTFNWDASARALAAAYAEALEREREQRSRTPR
ncbi:MAG: glycosyltransferase family 1 protein [Vicinamibacterales bacterium]